jgi:hypothetical protein
VPLDRIAMRRAVRIIAANLVACDAPKGERQAVLPFVLSAGPFQAVPK